MNIIGFSGLHNSVSFKKGEFPNLPPRLYHVCQGFDSAAALVTNDGVQAAAAEERFTGDKGTGAFPINAIRYCLANANIDLNGVDCIAHSFSYNRFKSFFDHNDFYRKQFVEVYSEGSLLRCIEQFLPSVDWRTKFVSVPHHLAHAASTFYMSGFEESLILVADAMGEIHSTTIAIGTKEGIKIVKQIPAVHSFGILYGVFTLFLGFEMGSDEYKVMGLAPYGNPNRYFGKTLDLVRFHDDGTYSIPILFSNNTLEEKETYTGTIRALEEVFGPCREPGADVTQNHMDIAAALQSVLQAGLMHVLRYAKKETSQNNLCMAGGVALNCTANSVISRSHMFKDIFVQPAAGDDGSALGAALYVQRQHHSHLIYRRMKLPAWGPSFDLKTIERSLMNRPECEAILYESFEELIEDIVQRIVEQQVVAWFQGRMEFGPRALGFRSILADPRDPEMRVHINRVVKNREEFRPFAPVVTAEAASRFFEVEAGKESLYAHMLFVTQTRADYRTHLPAVTHVDGSARVQIIFKEDNPRLWTLLRRFEQASAMPVLLNTSFNLRGQPIVCTPVQAIDTFIASSLDVLVMEDYVITRRRRDASGIGR